LPDCRGVIGTPMGDPRGRLPRRPPAAKETVGLEREACDKSLTVTSQRSAPAFWSGVGMEVDMQSSAIVRMLSVAVFAFLAAACAGPSAVPSASASTNVIVVPSPLANATARAVTAPSAAASAAATAISPSSASAAATPIHSPFRFQFVRNDGGGTVTIDVDDRSGLLVGITEGESFLVENPENESVIFQNDAADDSVLRVGWVAGGGCAANYSMTIGPAARTIRIEGPPEGSDSIGGNCDVTLRFSQPVLAGDVDGELVEG
jgi:hypothetical protein